MLAAEFLGQSPAAERLPAVPGQPFAEQPGQAAERVVGVVGGVGDGQRAGQVLETARVDQEPALPLQRVHLRMLTKHPSQLARPAPASAPDKERSAHARHLTSRPGWRQPDFRATGAFGARSDNS